MMSEAEVASRLTEQDLAYALVRQILEDCPSRKACSPDERRAQELVAKAFDELGIRTEFQAFRWNTSLYATIALHFGLGALGSAVATNYPWLSFLLHAGTASSYYLDSTRRAFLLRRAFSFRPSQNLVATMPSRGPRKLRVVLLSHADAAFTGLVFQPGFVRQFGARSGLLHKPLRVATAGLAALAVLDLVRIARGDSTWLRLARRMLTIAPLTSFALNADVVVRNHTVPGASDNLSGVVGGLILAKRFADRPLDHVELVFVTTGCEEAGLGGSQALLEEHRHCWSKDDTAVIAIDGLSGGALHYFLEGEITPIALHPTMTAALNRVIAQERTCPRVTPFAIPVGGTDSIPFARAGYQSVSIGRVDPVLHAPRNYHLPSDNLEHFSPQETVESVDFVEALVRELAQQHLTRAGV